MRIVLTVLATCWLSGSALAEDCGVYTDSAQEPGKVIAELGRDTMTLKSVPDFDYLYILEPQKAGEDFRWGWTETDAIGGVRLRMQGENLLLEIEEGMVDENGDPLPESDVSFHKAVYVPFCSVGA